MTAKVTTTFDRVFRRLEELGLLLLSGYGFPSVAGLIARNRIKGSWWSHPDAQTIFEVAELLDDHHDVLFLKLLDGKVTLVHRELWSRIFSIGVAREDWQMKTLTPSAKLLLRKIDAEGIVETGVLGKRSDPKPGIAARELESCMLIHSSQIHTQSGAHAKILETWDHWAKSVDFRGRAKNASAARRFLVERVESIVAEHDGTTVRFPWPPNV